MNPTDLMRDLVHDEPPFVLRPDDAIHAGRRRWRRRTMLVTGTAGAAALGTVGAFVVLSSPAPSTSVGVGDEPSVAAAP